MAILLFAPLTFAPLTFAQATTPIIVPDFELEDMEGNLISLAQHRGKVVMINFWATWCPPCIEEMPAMDALKTSLSDKPFEILAINMAEDRESVIRFLQRANSSGELSPDSVRPRLKFSFPLLLDPGGVVADQYAVKSLPATMLVDKNGKFIFAGVGAREWDSAEILHLILPLFQDAVSQTQSAVSKTHSAVSQTK